MHRRHFLAAAGAIGLTGLARSAAAAAEPVMAEVSDDGLTGRFFAAPGMKDRPAVLLLGGSGGGFQPNADAMDLARAGFPVLTLAYFKGFQQNLPDRLPAQLKDIPLEYFFKAIDWLKARPEVADRKVVVMGESRGGELSLLLAAHRPDLAGVIAFVPSHVVWGAVAPEGAAWTLEGKPLTFLDSTYVPKEPMSLAFIRALDGPAAAVEAAAIPVEKIRGRILLLSTEADGLWPSTRMADAVMARLEAKRWRGKRDHIRYPDASHLMMGTGPGITKMGSGAYAIDFGGTAEGTATARADAWARVKAFLGEV
ncbi:MAG TPA: acyl-CoA thioester hydrolase/BAAT C-terminal domain-containing protein [Caulobacteraceae bacterium]|nr:acyl-CoA thioester hydrolase/BAAT C-terminal domain-containing protein [Caulobacteraceae bacterium]